MYYFKDRFAKHSFLIIFSILFCIHAEAANYYFSNTGSDANSGTSTSTPWQSISKFNSVFASLNPGDKIFFKRGDTFRGSLAISRSGNADNQMVIGAYGAGAKPLFLGSRLANNLTDWLDQGGNIWQDSDPAFTVDVGNLIFNNEASCGVKLMSASPTFTTQGQFWYDFTNHRIKMYSVGNPASFYTNIQCALRYSAVNISPGVTYITLTNLDFRYYAQCVWEHNGDYITWDSVDMSYIGGADFHGDYKVRYGNGLQMWKGRHDITIAGCNISNIYDSGISPQGWAVGGGFTVYNIYMRNNIISNCEMDFEFWEQDSSSTAHDIYFESNTCTNGGGSWGHNQRTAANPIHGTCIYIYFFNAAKANIFIRNNILYNATESLIKVRTAPGHPVSPAIYDLTNMIFDYNDYYQPKGGLIAYVNWDRVSYPTLDLWKSEISQEAHSIASDPLFISESDFHLRAGSPAIHAGLEIGLPFTGRAPNMGAFK